MWRWHSLAVLVALHFVAGCYEIPPTVPSDYVGGPSESPGWPPPAAYAANPLHPRNRWFHRVFSIRDSRGEIAPVSGAEPLPFFQELSMVDRAEIAALLETSRRESAGTAQEPAGSRSVLTETLFRSDALQVALRLSTLEATGDSAQDLLRLLVDSTIVEDDARLPAAGQLPDLVAPPPLRQGTWRELEPPSSPGLLPSARDIRWTRRLHQQTADEDEPRVLLLRMRVTLLRTGDPRLLPVASECWELRRRRGVGFPLARVWRFDRAAWVAGKDPWTPVPGNRVSAISDPETVGGRVLRGPVVPLCGECHAGWKPAPGPLSELSEVPPPSQEERIREVIERQLGSVLGGRRSRAAGTGKGH